MKFYEIDWHHAGNTPTLMKLETDESLNIESLDGEHGRADIPIIGEGSGVKVNRTDKGLIIVRGDWDKEKDDRCLVIVRVDEPMSLHYDFDDDVKLVTSGCVKAELKSNSYVNFLLILTPGGEFSLRSAFSIHPPSLPFFWYMWEGEIGGWMIEHEETRGKRKAHLSFIEEVKGGEWL